MFVLWSVLFVWFMGPMFVFIGGYLSIGTEIVGVNVLCLLSVSCFFGGAVPVVGDASAASVLRSPNLSPQQCGWPLGPSTPFCVPLNVLLACCREI